MGIRVEMALAALFAAVYVASKTRNWVRSLVAGLGVYTIIFVWMALPPLYQSFMAIFSKYVLPGWIVVQLKCLTYRGDYIRIYLFSLLVMIPVYLWMLGLKTVPNFFKLDLKGFKIRRNTLLALARNIRPLRVVHYCIFVLIGFFWGVHYTNVKVTFINIIEIVLLLVSVLFAWAFAVGVNDIYDQGIDRVSNTDRPLIKGSISAKEYSIYLSLFAVVSLMLALAVSFWSANMIFYFLVYYSYVYSAPPLRLRQYLFLPNIIIGICSLLCVLAGFSVFGGRETFALIPKGMAFFIFLAFSLASTVKDLKDYEGDKAAGIATLPTLLGAACSKIIDRFPGCGDVCRITVVYPYPEFLDLFQLLFHYFFLHCA